MGFDINSVSVDKYSVTVLRGIDGLEGLKTSRTVICTNRRAVGLLTGISDRRLTYLFTNKKLEAVIEDGYFIARVFTEYRGNQRVGNMGGGYNRNR